MNTELPTIPLEFYKLASPIFVLAIGAAVLMLQSVTRSAGGLTAVKSVLFTTLVLAILGTVATPSGIEAVFLDGGFVSQALTRFGSLLVLLTALVVAILASATYLKQSFFRGEISSLFVFVVLGMLTMMSADDLVSVFTGLEISSIGLYALIGYIQPNRRSVEGAVKYLLLGSFATAFLLLGFALLYAGTGSLKISTIVASLAKASDQS